MNNSSHIENSAIILTPPRKQIADPDKILPFPNRSLINYDRYCSSIGFAPVRYNISLLSSRGCPFGCLYCHKIWPKQCVRRSADNLFSELKLYYNIGIRRFTIVDDIFNLDSKNSAEFFKLILKHKFKIHLFFPNGLRGDLLTKDYIDLMITAGTKSVALALESASPRIQKLLNKNLDITKLHNNLEYIANTYPHILLELFMMHGFPTETKQEAISTIEFCQSIKWVAFPYLNILKIFPNTEIANFAINNGISMEKIQKSECLAYHQLPETLPFETAFTRKIQSEFLVNYILDKERLLHTIPHQMKIFTENEFLAKYNSYLPFYVNSFQEFLSLAKLAPDSFQGQNFLDPKEVEVPNLNKKIKCLFPRAKKPKPILKILLIDVTQYFANTYNMLYDVVEPPLGLMYLATYLLHTFGSKIAVKIIKPRFDYDSFAGLQQIITNYSPTVIGLRSLTFFKDFFHITIAKIREYGFTGPIVVGGPYATANYPFMLNDTSIDIAVLGEGEITFSELISSIIDNLGTLPTQERLKAINGLAFRNRG